MRAKLNNELLRHLEETEQRQPQREIPVIVTFRKGADISTLEEKGFNVQRTFESISAVSATLTPAQVREVAQLDSVVTIEYDGKVYALEA